ncbi:EpsG family protein [Pseudomonas sp. NPDC089395]|uniref:EpsG family protein n=1 Tax=Pseudomonas sp. NPDC089395 TaxID=3364460 RepID=UPI0038282FB7
MFFYIFLAVVLVPFYILEVWGAPKARVTAGFLVLIAFIYFVFVAGFRDDTGYDWYVYKKIYEGVESSDGLLAAIQFGNENGAETGFSVLLYLLGLCGVSFWGVQALVCLFNFYAFVRLNSLLGMGLVSGFFVYYCWLFLVLQMAVMRMSVALSLLILGMIALLRGRYLVFALLVAVSTTVHLFSLAIGVVVLCAKLRFSRTFVASVLSVVVILYGLGLDVFGIGLEQTLGYMPAFIASKVEIYLRTSQLYVRGAGEFLYKLLMLGIFFYVFVRADWRNDLERYLVNLGFIYIVFLFLFWKYPVFHDRIKYFVLVPYFHLLLMVVMRQKIHERGLVGMGFMLISLAVLVHEVRGPLFYPYTPYYNIAERWLGGQENDGEERTMKYYEDYNAQWLESGGE